MNTISEPPRRTDADGAERLFGTLSSVAILLRLESGGLTRREIDLLYKEEEMVAGRVARLVANGFLVVTPSGYAVSDRGHVLLHSFARLRRFFGHDQLETQP